MKTDKLVKLLRQIADEIEISSSLNSRLEEELIKNNQLRVKLMDQTTKTLRLQAAIDKLEGREKE